MRSTLHYRTLGLWCNLSFSSIHLRKLIYLSLLQIALAIVTPKHISQLITNPCHQIRQEQKNRFLTLAKSSDEESFVIRNAELDDLGDVSLLLTDGFFAKNTNFITFQLERLKTYFSLEDTFPRYENETDHVMLVLCRLPTKQIIGFAEVDNRRQKMSVKDYGGLLRRPYMCNLVVDEKYKRRGFGKMLIRECEKICSVVWSEKCLFLKVRGSNRAALKLYRGLEYEVEEKLTNEDILVLKKYFKAE